VALAAVSVAAGCGNAARPTATTTAGKPPAARHPSAPPPRPGGGQARAARSVARLADALKDGDVAHLCRPGAVFTPEVVAELNSGGVSCEASLELSGPLSKPPPLTVTSLALERDLAVAQVRVGGGATIPLDLVRDRGRWLVSFSKGIDPITAMEQ
jgi:hypothetical protein